MTRPRLLGRSRSPASRPRISSARTAVSYSIRHSALSRSGTSSFQIAVTCARVSALVVSTGTFGLAHPAVGSLATHPAEAHQAMADLSVDRCRARVAGASAPNAAVNASCSAPAPAGVPRTATSAAADGARARSRPPRAARVCRYFTAVPSTQAPGAAWAMTKASAAWPNAGAGSWATGASSLPQEMRTGQGCHARDPVQATIARRSRGRWIAAGNRSFPAARPGWRAPVALPSASATPEPRA